MYESLCVWINEKAEQSELNDSKHFQGWKLFWISTLWLSLQKNICSIYQISIFQCMKECSLPTSKQNSWNNTMQFRIPCQECCITVWCCVLYVSFEFFSMVIEDSGFMVCVTTLRGKWLLTFWQILRFGRPRIVV